MLRIPLLLLPLSVVGLFLAVGSCGGGGGHAGRDVEFYATPLAALDGWVHEDLGFNASSGSGVYVGDSPTWNREYRGYLSFDLTGLPAGAVVRAAYLDLRMWDVSGDPFPGFGDLRISHVLLTTPLSGDDFDPVVLDPTFDVVTSNETWNTITIDVRAQVGADGIAGRSRISFMLHFQDPNDWALTTNGTSDGVCICDAEGHGGSPAPTLTILYTPP